MTALGQQIHDQYFPQFTFLGNKAKRGNQNDSSSMNVKKSRGGQPAPRGATNKNFASYPTVYSSQQRAGSNKKSGSTQSYMMKNENQYMFNHFAKGNGYKATPEKNTRTYLLSTASESDASPASEMAGFKIVHAGKTLYDETGEDFDLSFDSEDDFEMNLGMGMNTERFAASVLTMGPNASDISMPSFL